MTAKTYRDCPSIGLSLYAVWEMLGLPSEAREHVVTLGAWIPPIPLATANGIGSFEIPWAFRLSRSATSTAVGTSI